MLICLSYKCTCEEKYDEWIMKYCWQTDIRKHSSESAIFCRSFHFSYGSFSDRFPFPFSSIFSENSLCNRLLKAEHKTKTRMITEKQNEWGIIGFVVRILLTNVFQRLWAMSSSQRAGQLQVPRGLLCVRRTGYELVSYENSADCVRPVRANTLNHPGILTMRKRWTLSIFTTGYNLPLSSF